MPEGLRFGLLCGGTTFQRWEADCLHQLLAVEGVKLALLVVDARPLPQPNPWYKKWKALRNRDTLLFEMYRKYRVERRIPGRQSVDLSAEMAQVPRMDVQVNLRGKFSEYFSSEDVEKIRSARLDFLIRFGFNIIRGDILSSARFGVWSFHHDDLDRYRGGPPCFWEVYFGDPQTGITLQRLTDTLDSGVVLRKESFATCLDSYPQNMARGLEFGVSWPASLCRGILAGDTALFDKPPSSTKAPIYRLPKNGQLLRMLLGRGKPAS